MSNPFAPKPTSEPDSSAADDNPFSNSATLERNTRPTSRQTSSYGTPSTNPFGVTPFQSSGTLERHSVGSRSSYSQSGTNQDQNPFASAATLERVKSTKASSAYGSSNPSRRSLSAYGNPNPDRLSISSTSSSKRMSSYGNGKNTAGNRSSVKSQSNRVSMKKKGSAQSRNSYRSGKQKRVSKPVTRTTSYRAKTAAGRPVSYGQGGQSVVTDRPYSYDARGVDIQDPVVITVPQTTKTSMTGLSNPQEPWYDRYNPYVQIDGLLPAEFQIKAYKKIMTLAIITFVLTIVAMSMSCNIWVVSVGLSHAFTFILPIFGYTVHTMFYALVALAAVLLNIFTFISALAQECPAGIVVFSVLLAILNGIIFFLLVQLDDVLHAKVNNMMITCGCVDEFHGTTRDGTIPPTRTAPPRF